MSGKARAVRRTWCARRLLLSCRRRHRLQKLAMAIFATGPEFRRPRDQSNVDIAYGAFQRGHYITAFNEASKRAQQNDPAAMTLLGELYAQGLGVGRDDSKAAQWYKLAAAKGDRDAMFALAMFNFQGRAGARDLSEAARLLESAAKLGHAGAAYDLGLLYMQGQQFAQDFKRAGELFAHRRGSGQFGSAIRARDDVQGRPRRDEGPRPKQRGSCSRPPSPAISTPWSSSPSRNSTATARRRTKARRRRLFLKAAHLGSPIAQNRLARILMAGRGMPADPTEAVKWHMVAKAGGASDPDLDVFAGKQTPEVREAADKAAKKWLSTMAPARP